MSEIVVNSIQIDIQNISPTVVASKKLEVGDKLCKKFYS